MHRILARIVDRALALCRAGTLAAFSVLVAVVTIQVLGRIPGFPSPAWTEEVARFALVYLVAFSCGIAVFHGELVNVDLFVEPLPPRARRFVERVVDLIVAAFCLCVLPGAFDYVVGSFGERARSLDVPMVAVYVVTLIIPISLTFFSLLRFIGLAPVKGGVGHGDTR